MQEADVRGGDGYTPWRAGVHPLHPQYQPLRTAGVSQAILY